MSAVTYLNVRSANIMNFAKDLMNYQRWLKMKKNQSFEMIDLVHDIGLLIDAWHLQNARMTNQPRFTKTA